MPISLDVVSPGPRAPSCPLPLVSLTSLFRLFSKKDPLASYIVRKQTLFKILVKVLDGMVSYVLTVIALPFRN